MAVAYKSSGAGSGTETNGASLNLNCPASVSENDILIAHVIYLTNSYGPDTPDGWTRLYTESGLGAGLGTGTPTGRAYVYGKIAVGNEDGTTISFGTAGGTAGRYGRIYSFSGWVSGTLSDVVPTASFADTPSETDPFPPDITTTVTGSLAVALVAQDDNNAIGSFTGESGGNWTEAVAEYVSTSIGAQGCMCQLQTAIPTDNPGKITGGTYNTNNDENSTIVFEIRPKSPNSPPEIVLNSPSNEAVLTDHTPDLTFTGTDDDEDDLEYEIQVATDSDFTSEGVYSAIKEQTSGSTSWSIYSGQRMGASQSFYGTGKAVYKAKFKIWKTGTPTGDIVVRLYAHTGTFGSSGKPTGSPLATSTPISIEDLGTSSAYCEFEFTGDNIITLTNETPYCIAFEYSGGDSSNYLSFNVYTGGSSEVNGNGADLLDGDWYDSSYILPFGVYSYTPASIILDAVSETDAGFTSGHPFASGDEITFTSRGGDLISDSYSLSNSNTASSVTPANFRGQTFKGNGSVLKSCEFYLARYNYPVGDMVVKIYAHTGTFGTDGMGTGDVLAVSEPINANLVTETTASAFVFSFIGSNCITLEDDTPYAVILCLVENTGSGSISLSIDTSTKTHSGNYCSTFEGNWSYTSYDTCFSIKTYGSSLDIGTYYWRVRAIDPDGSNTYGEWSSTRSFDISGTAASSDRLLYTKGKAAVSSDELLYTRGKLTNSSDRFLYSNGGLAGSSDRLLYSKGISTGSTDRGLYTKGKLADTSERLLYTKSSASSSSDRFLYTRGISTSFSTRQLYTKGSLSAFSERLIYTEGISTSFSVRNLYTKGISTGFSLRGIYSKGSLPGSSTRNLYTKGISTSSSDRSLYSVGEGAVNSERGLYTLSEALGDSERGIYTTGKETGFSLRNLYTKGFNSSSSDRLLYSKGIDTGFSDRTLCTEGSAISSSTRNIYSRGSLAAESTRNLYTKGGGIVNSERGIYSIGRGIVNSQRGIYTLSEALGASERLIYTKSVAVGFSTRSLYSVGCLPANSERTIYSKGYAIGYSERSLHTSANAQAYSERSLYLRGDGEVAPPVDVFLIELEPGMYIGTVTGRVYFKL